MSTNKITSRDIATVAVNPIWEGAFKWSFAELVSRIDAALTAALYCVLRNSRCFLLNYVLRAGVKAKGNSRMRTCFCTLRRSALGTVVGGVRGNNGEEFDCNWDTMPVLVLNYDFCKLVKNIWQLGIKCKRTKNTRRIIAQAERFSDEFRESILLSCHNYNTFWSDYCICQLYGSRLLRRYASRDIVVL